MLRGKQFSARNAAKSGDIQCTNLMHHHGLSINCKTDWIGGDGFTPLLLAAQYSSWPMFKFLVDRGADTTARTSGRETALTLAQRSVNPDRDRICRYLKKPLTVTESGDLVRIDR